MKTSIHGLTVHVKGNAWYAYLEPGGPSGPSVLVGMLHLPFHTDRSLHNAEKRHAQFRQLMTDYADDLTDPAPCLDPP